MRTKGGNNPIDLLVGSRIRMFRKGRGMSQAQLGEKLGVNSSKSKNTRTARIAWAPAGYK
jgi:transcriptional regulator with XRE-family HTH domain